jgi:leucine-zipper of insertion element IS481
MAWISAAHRQPDALEVDRQKPIEALLEEVGDAAAPANARAVEGAFEASAPLDGVESLVVVPKHVVRPGPLEAGSWKRPQSQGGHRMKLHANAKSCPNSRWLFCRRVEEQSWSLEAAAEAAGFSERTGHKWLARLRSEGNAGLEDRSSAPKTIPHRTPADRVQAIGTFRRLRMTAAEIAEILQMGFRSGGLAALSYL